MTVIVQSYNLGEKIILTNFFFLFQKTSFLEDLIQSHMALTDIIAKGWVRFENNVT